MLDMMNRFRGLILSLSVLMVLAGCIERVQIQKPEPVQLFNREYYAVKNLTRSDIRKLKDLMISDDKSAAKTAGLILGRHHVRNGDIDEGYRLIKENLDDSYLDRFVRISGHLWFYDAASKKGMDVEADMEREYLENIRVDAKAEKAFRHYCAQEKKVITADVKSCVLAEKPEQESEIEIEIFEEPKKIAEVPIRSGAPLMEKIVLNVKSAESDPKLMEAMLYSISKLGVDVELDFTGEREDYDYTLDAYTKIITSKTHMYEFGLEMEKVFEEAVNLAMLNGGVNLVIGYTPELLEKTQEMEDKYKDSDVKIYKFDITDKSFQSTLKSIKEQIGEDKAISFAVAGSEKELVKIVPFLRFYSDKPDKSVISIAVDGFGKLFFNSQYIEYFKKAYVVTEVLLLGNSAIEKFNEDYYSDYTKLPTVKDMLGYDIIVFLEKLKNPSFMNEYLTNIRNLEEGRTVRDMGAYQIVSYRKVRKLIN